MTWDITHETGIRNLTLWPKLYSVETIIQTMAGQQQQNKMRVVWGRAAVSFTWW